MRKTSGGKGAGDRIGDEVGDRHGRIDDAIHERRIGAVLEQAPHQVGQQRFVRAYRSVDAAGAAPVLLADDLVEQALPHAVQALELEIAIARERADGRDRERVVARELWIDRVLRGQQRLGARQIRDVRMDLAREHRVTGQAVDLRALDLGVPVGAFDQPHHEAALMPAAEIDQPVDHRAGALLIALHDKA